MNTEIVIIEIEELEAKTAPQAPAGFLDYYAPQQAPAGFLD
ncbi:MAG TPA: hypothetical protein VE422_25795 [Terriglobia bacterium]|nr:hypothetical protein [Terriglobia bacterium]